MVTGRPTKLEPPDPCTIDPAEWEVLTGFSHPFAYSHEVGPAPVGVRLLDEDLVVYRTSQDVVARQGNVCLHRGSQLTLGSIDGDELVCRYHAWRYGPEGRCTRIPFGQAERTDLLRDRRNPLRAVLGHRVLPAQMAFSAAPTSPRPRPRVPVPGGMQETWQKARPGSSIRRTSSLPSTRRARNRPLPLRGRHPGFLKRRSIEGSRSSP